MRMRMAAAFVTASLLLSLLLSMPASVASAQRAELSSGVRLRLRAPGVLARSVDGIVVGQRPDTLLFAPLNGAPIAVPIAAISEVLRYRGVSRLAGFKHGALWGGGIGAALGLLNAAFSDCAGRYCSTSAKLTGTLTFTGLGAVIGGAIGAGRGATQWERLHWERPSHSERQSC